MSDQEEFSAAWKTQTGEFGKRPDGSAKGRGFYGVLKRPDGNVSTEISVGVNLDDKEQDIPTLVPGLSRQEIDHLLNGGQPTDAIVDKAVRHARERMQAGKPLFAGDDEPIAPLPGAAP